MKPTASAGTPSPPGHGRRSTDDGKAYQFGDPFLLDLKETLMRSVERGVRASPVRLTPDDFDVYRTEQITQSSTVLMVDMCRSMLYNGYFAAAKKVALALTPSSAASSRATTSTSSASRCSRASSRPAQLPSLPGRVELGTNMHAASCSRAGSSPATRAATARSSW